MRGVASLLVTPWLIAALNSSALACEGESGSVSGLEVGGTLTQERANELIDALLPEAPCRPKLLKSVAPMVPRRATREGLGGDVEVKILVNGVGDVEAIRIVSSPHGTFSEAVSAAVKQWKYQPLLVNGQARRFVVVQRFSFKIAP